MWRGWLRDYLTQIHSARIQQLSLNFCTQPMVPFTHTVDLRKFFFSVLLIRVFIQFFKSVYKISLTAKIDCLYIFLWFICQLHFVLWFWKLTHHTIPWDGSEMEARWKWEWYNSFPLYTNDAIEITRAPIKFTYCHANVVFLSHNLTKDTWDFFRYNWNSKNLTPQQNVLYLKYYFELQTTKFIQICWKEK